MPGPQPLHVKAGQILFRPGDDCPGFMRLTRGSIKVSMTAANGREVVLYRVGPGDLCLQSFACLTEGQSYAAEGIAESDLEGEIVAVPDFKRAMDDDPGFRSAVLSAVARRFADYEQLVEDVALTGFDARLARVLLRLQDAQGEIRATHENLAAETASGRAFVSRRLADFAARGLVALHRGRLSVLDADALREISSDVT